MVSAKKGAVVKVFADFIGKFGRHQPHILVGGIPTPLKILVIGMIIPNIWKIKAMFQTTNQYKKYTKSWPNGGNFSASLVVGHQPSANPHGTIPTFERTYGKCHLKKIKHMGLCQNWDAPNPSKSHDFY
jgi:hypothetical protein